MDSPLLKIEKFVNAGIDEFRNRFFEEQPDSYSFPDDGFVETQICDPNSDYTEIIKTYFADLLKIELRKIMDIARYDIDQSMHSPMYSFKRADYINTIVNSIEYLRGQLIQKAKPIEHELINEIFYDTSQYLKGKYISAPEPVLDITLAQQVIALKYLVKASADKEDYNKTDFARFVQMMTGREQGAKSITNTNIYKQVNKSSLKLGDLNKVRSIFQQLRVPSAIKLIDEEIKNLG